MLIDTHCHIHEADYPLDGDEVIKHANQAGVQQIICVGTNFKTSKETVEFVEGRENVFASIGIHPHFAKEDLSNVHDLIRLVDTVSLGNDIAPGLTGASAPGQTWAAGVSLKKGMQQNSGSYNRKIVAIGEIGLDYFYTHSSREDQIKLLESQIQLALKYGLPIIFHVRDAFDDFWPVFDKFNTDDKPISGVLHCYTDSWENAQKAIQRGLYFGVNGISTFTRDESQKQMFANLPLDKILLETDAPALTPSPLRGKVKINEPAYIREIAEFGSAVHQISFDEFARITTANARALFNL